MDRLTQVNYNNGAHLTYTYDDVGNRLSESGTNPTDPSKSVDRTYSYYANSNRLQSITDAVDSTKSVTFLYDGNGNRTAATSNGVTTPYYYNILDELVLTAAVNGAPVEFDYDTEGMRIKKLTAVGETSYLYADGATLQEYDGATGKTETKYNYGLNLISMTSVDPTTNARSSQFYTVDGLGSTSELTDEAGAIQISQQFDAWGQVLFTVGSSDNTKQFTGQELDQETGLQYFGARYYDPFERHVHHPGQIPGTVGPSDEHEPVYLRLR